MSRFSFLLAGAIGLVVCAHCSGSSFEFADASVDGLAGSGSGAGSGSSSSGGGTGSGSGGSSGAHGGSSSSASSGAGSGSGGGHGSSSGGSSGIGGNSSGAGSGGSGSGSGGASSGSSSGSSGGSGSSSGGRIDGGNTCLSNGCDAGTTCCGLSCCAAGQLCCAFSGPVPPVDPYYCLTPTASQPTCPVGCAPKCLSDRTVKRDIEPVDERAVLERVSQLPISTWSYRADSPSVRHLGPMAQDFFAEFGLGDSDRSYDPIDAHGVALAAIKALHEQLREQSARIEALERENQELRAPAVCR